MVCSHGSNRENWKRKFMCKRWIRKWKDKMCLRNKLKEYIQKIEKNSIGIFFFSFIWKLTYLGKNECLGQGEQWTTLIHAPC